MIKNLHVFIKSQAPCLAMAHVIGIILGFLLSMFLNFNASAQTIDWQSNLDQITGSNQHIIATSDGGYSIATLVEYSTIQFNILDMNGKQILKKSYISGVPMSTIIATNDGGYLVGGVTYDNYWVMKLDKNLTHEWEETYGGDSTEILTSLVANKDGSFLIGGTSYSKKSGAKSQNMKGISDYWIVKIDNKGKKLWDKSFGGIKSPAIEFYVNSEDSLVSDTINTGHSYLNNIIETPEGEYLLGGSSDSFAGGDNTTATKYTTDYPEWDSWDHWVIKMDKNGNKIWDNTYRTGSYRPAFRIITSTLDGGYLITSTEYYDRGPADYGNYDTIIKINGFGKHLWIKYQDDFNSIVSTLDGGFLVGCTSDKNRSENSEKSEDGKGGNDYWVIKYSADGTKIWDKTIGGEKDDYLTTLLITADGKYLLAGSSNSNISGNKTVKLIDLVDLWFVKVKEDKQLTWNLRYGGSGDENFTTILKTADGGYLSGGYSNSNMSGDKTQTNQGKNDYWIVKSDKDGKKLWDKRYGGTGDDYLNRIIQTADGGYLLAGSSLSGKSGNKTQASRGDRDYWIVKVNNSGIYQWDKSFGGKSYDELKKVIQLSTGEYILAGYSISPAGGDKSQNSQGGADFWVVKVNKTGTKIWDKRYGGNLNDLLSGIVETADGGYLLSGSSSSGKGGDKSQVSRGGSDFWIVRVDKNGKKLWDKTYGGSGQDEAFSSGRNGNDFFIAGQSNSPAGADKTRGSQGAKDFWLLKLTSSGAKVWDKRYGGSKDDELKASIITKDGGYILAGKSFSDKSGNKSQNSQGSSDYWIVKTDKEGFYQWDKRFGGSGAEDLRAVTQTQDGGLLLAGKSDSGVSGDRTQPSQGETDYWLVKVAPETKPIVATREASEIEEPITSGEINNLQAYPNPFSNKATISFTLPDTQQATIKVYDGQGREAGTLFQGEAKAKQTYKVEWEASNKATGLYIIQLQTPTLRQQQKLLLVK